MIARETQFGGHDRRRIARLMAMLLAIRRFGNARFWSFILGGIALGGFCFLSFITFRHINQPLVDVHSTRQTQTAVSAYWMLMEGWVLAYQTPVVGFPWSIPFEFPIYQALVAGLAAISGFALEPVGRFVSYVFVAACAWPAFALAKRLQLPRTVPVVFCALLWTSPLYVYWGRTFMIETAATFFSFACLPYAIDVVSGHGRVRSVLLFLLLATAGVLQKSTTGGPVLLFVLGMVVVEGVRRWKFDAPAIRRTLGTAAIVVVPVVVGLAWARYADTVKMTNPFGRQLTSQSLGTWNFGDLGQKLDWEIWKLVVWTRALQWNASGVYGAMVLGLPLLGNAALRRYAPVTLGAIALFLLPVAIFTNLHFVHEYYQVACVIFLLAALAIAIGGWLATAAGTMTAAAVLLFFVISNVVFFRSTYGIMASRPVEQMDDRTQKSYWLGRHVREHTRPGTGIVVFGHGYSSEIGFQAQRKAMTVPEWFYEYDQVWRDPQAYLGPLPLGAIVVWPQPGDGDRRAELLARLASDPDWEHVVVLGCDVLIPRSSKAADVAPLEPPG